MRSSFLLPVALAALVGWASFYAPLPLPAPFQHILMAPPEALGTVAPQEGPLAVNTLLQEADDLFEGKVIAPETIKFDQKGRMYLFTEKGIYRASPNGDSFHDPELLVDIKGGRPLSGDFGANETLYVCDVIQGLVKVDIESGEYEILLSNDVVHFCDDVVVSSENEIFIADASDLTVPSQEATLKCSFVFVASGRRGGRLLKYNPETGAVETLMSGLKFANGVELSHDESYILVSDGSAALKVRWYWLKGPKKGTEDVFMDSLPGYSDGINKGPDSTYWIAIFSRVDAVQKAILNFRLVSWVCMYLPASVQQSLIHRHEMVIQVDGQGKVLRSFQDPSNNYGRTTSAYEWNGRLYIGSFNNLVRVLDLRQKQPPQ